MGQSFYRNLQTVGFSSYDEYLQSEKWATIRVQVFALKGNECRCCGNPATQVHHKCYDVPVLDGFNLNPLEPICSACHDLIHSKGNLSFANREFNRLCSKQNPRKPMPRKVKPKKAMNHLLREMAEIASGVYGDSSRELQDKVIAKWTTMIHRKK